MLSLTTPATSIRRIFGSAASRRQSEKSEINCKKMVVALDDLAVGGSMRFYVDWSPSPVIRAVQVAR